MFASLFVVAGSYVLTGRKICLVGGCCPQLIVFIFVRASVFVFVYTRAGAVRVALSVNILVLRFRKRELKLPKRLGASTKHCCTAVPIGIYGPMASLVYSNVVR